ncbi:hypothetical protein [Glaciibacter flavus]|uniref:hypothetical protein n=1 Tax=Orlajensenia flava TaxID=2565934 RepID=UPI003B002B04
MRASGRTASRRAKASRTARTVTVLTAALAALAMSAALAGCTSAPVIPIESATPKVSAPDSSAPQLGPLGAPDCTPASPVVTGGDGFPEVQGTSTDGSTLYGLIMASTVPLAASDDTAKFVWRMTGDGAVTVRVTDPAGHEKTPAWGPERHGGSSYHRPGDEWGTGIVLSQPGCWTVHLHRSTGDADVWLDVLPPGGS